MSFLALAACTTTGKPTDSVCPQSNAPTYGSFGQVFFQTYCTGCHSSTATNRNGAPSDLNYDTEDDIKLHLAVIDEEAAAGPAATNTEMPLLDGPVSVAPTAAERMTLGQFLACEKAGQ